MNTLIETIEQTVNDTKKRHILIELVKVCILVLNSVFNLKCI